MKFKSNHSDITERIIKCALKVHNELKHGYTEVIYQRALEIELGIENLEFKREHEAPVYYNKIEIGTQKLDFLVEDKICVELKAKPELEESHFAQIYCYLESNNIEIGLLINFGEQSLKFRHLRNKKYKQHYP